MPINPNIALAVKGIELQDPLAQYGKVAAIQGAQQQNQLAQLQMQNLQREQESTNALNRAYAEAYNPQTGEVDVNKLRGSLSTGGFGSKLPGIEKGLLELGEAKTKQQKAQTDLLDSKLKQSRQFLETIDPSSPNAAEAYMQWHKANHADPVIGKALEARGITVDQSMQRIQQLLNTPGGLNRLINESKLGTEKFMELNKPQLSTTDLGGKVESRTFAPLTGELKTIGTQTKTMAPGESQRIANENTRLGLEGRRVAVLEEKAKDSGVPGAQLSKKEIQSREAAFPKATTAIKSFEADAGELISDLERLKNHPGLSNITGFVAGRTPSLTAQGRAAQALYDKIIAKGGFQSLQDVRNASPTGGALGSISNQEGQQLKSAFSEIDQKMDAPDVRGAIDRTIQKVQGSKNRVKEGYDLTYEYRAPAAPAAGGVIDFGSLK